MTLLVDPPMLYAVGRSIGKRTQPGPSSTIATAAFAGGILWLSAASYNEVPAARPFWKAFGGKESGRDLILNSWGLLHFDPDVDTPARRRTVVALFALYPAWAMLGLRSGRRRRR